MKDFMSYLSNIKSIQIRFKPRNQKFCDFLKGMGNRHAWNIYKSLRTPRKIRMEPQHGGLEDDFPFQLGDS